MRAVHSRWTCQCVQTRAEGHAAGCTRLIIKSFCLTHTLIFLSTFHYRPNVMFSFFSRKQQQPSTTQKQSDAMVVDSVVLQQLRTPSPSEAASNGLGSAAHMATPSLETPTLDPPKPALPPTPEALHALISTIPAKTLHAYVLAHLPTTSPDTLAALAAFFATLTPPPRLHCVRCHSDYTEIENTDRSCHVPHDDDSAYVERVGLGRGTSEYETQYGCCGKTVEGEGDLGPPDGWCYEGMHTVSLRNHYPSCCA
jgi:hypothetical protein